MNQIRKGRTKIDNLWIKHADLDDEGRREELYSFFFDLAKKRKVKTEDEAIKIAQKNKKWTNEDEVELKKTQSYLIALRQNEERQVIKEQKKYLEEQIERTFKKLNELSTNRISALGKTAEMWADRMSAERYVLSMVFKDENFKQRRWEEIDIEYVEEDEINYAYSIFIEVQNQFAENKIKDLAITGICQNLFNCADGGVLNFFGLNVLNLTLLQQRLFSTIKNYSNIISSLGEKAVPSIQSDWEKLEAWAKANEKGREQIERSWNVGDKKITMDAIRKSAATEGSDIDKAKNVQKLLDS